MRFQVLGPVQAWCGDHEINLGSPKQRLLCGALLLAANRFVPVDRIGALLWPGALPSTARRTIQAYVSRLRTALLLAGAAPYGVTLLRRGAGYQLNCDPELIDAHRFQRLVESAGAADDCTAAGLLQEALDLWRGPPLADVTDDEQRARWWGRLVEARLEAGEELADIQLRLGGHAHVLEDLAELAREHPHRQRVLGLRMLALHRCGRTAEALQVFDEARRRLADELGIDPSADVQRLHVAILREVPATDAASAAPAGEPVGSARSLPAPPAQLPADIANFTGREVALAALDGLLQGDSANQGTALPVVVITGTPGVGKTALAVHWGHSVRSRFPDGQLFVNLRGFSGAPSMRPIDALARFLRALGYPADRVPVDAEQAADAYRTLVADRRVLVVLDNASDAEQVRCLLPGGSGCLVVVTSRNRLGGLVAGEGARRVDLGVLAESEAWQLLERVIGVERVRAEPLAAAELIALCARLPLALRIVAANLLDRPREDLAGSVARLQADDRVAVLTVAGDEQRAVRSAFDLSYRALSAPARRMFRLLGLAPGTDVSVPAAAALSATTTDAAATLLGELAGSHLLEQDVPGRYSCHDLLRSYAAERATSEDEEGDRQAAIERLTWWYERAADTAARVLYPQRLRLPAGTGNDTAQEQVSVPVFTDAAQAMAWLEVERANLVLVVQRTALSGPREVAWRLADTMRGYFWTCMHTVDWLAVGIAGVSAAQREGGPAARSAAHFNLGDALVRQSRYRPAAEQFEQALALAEQEDWTPMRSACLGSLGSVYLNAGEPGTAHRYLLRALDLARLADARFSEAVLLGGLGVTHRELGRLDASVAAFDEARRVFGECGVRQGEMGALGGLGETYHVMGRLDQAAACFTQALDGLRELGDRSGQSDFLPGLAAVERSRGRVDIAQDLATTALELALEINDRRAVATARNVLGSVHHGAGRYPHAVEQYRTVLELTAESSDHHPRVEAEIGLAEAYHATDRPDLALAHARRAVDLARQAEYRLLADRAAAVLAVVDAARH